MDINRVDGEADLRFAMRAVQEVVSPLQIVNGITAFLR